MMKVVREITVEVPGLGQRIREARLADKRSLEEITTAIDMSKMNWYRIEAELQKLPEQTLRKLEGVLGVDFGVKFDD